VTLAACEPSIGKEPKSAIATPVAPSTWFRQDAGYLLSDHRFVVLTNTQRGMYITLVAHAWSGGGLSADDEDVYALVRGSGGTRKDLERVLKAFFTAQGPNGRSTPELEADRTRAREISNKRSYAASQRRDRNAPD